MGVWNAGLRGRRILCYHFFSHCFFHVMLNRLSPVLALLLSCKTMLLERERESSPGLLCGHPPAKSIRAAWSLSESIVLGYKKRTRTWLNGLSKRGWKFLKKLWCCVGGGNKIIWLYQLSWKCKLATVMSIKLTFRALALRQSVSPSSER